MGKKPAPLRYSDKELADFKLLLEEKLEKSMREHQSLLEQIRELTESLDTERADLVDNSLTRSEGDMLRTMTNRTEKYIQNIKNALSRIENKTYGICSVSGKLISKKRLLAVPITTQSLESKTAPVEKPKAKVRPRIKSTIVNKVQAKTNKKDESPMVIIDEDEEEEDELGLDFEEADLSEEDIDLLDD